MSLTESGLDEARQALLRNRLHGSAGAKPVTRVPRRSGSGPVPLTPAQHGVWLSDQFKPDNSVSGVYRMLWLHGPLDAEALDKALCDVAARHEALRSTYADTDDGPEQTISDVPTTLLRFVALSAVGVEQRRAEAAALTRAAVEEPFDLEAGPVFSAFAMQVNAEEHLLVIRMHHLVTDEVSGGLLGAELNALYAAHRTRRPPELPEAPIRFTDFAAWSATEPQRRARERQLEHWIDVLRDVPPILDLPTDRSRPENPGFHGAVEKLSLDPATTAGLREFAIAHGGTMFSTLLALFGAALYRHSGQRRFSVGTLLSCRGLPEVESMIGMFATTVPIPVDLTGRPSFATAARRAGAAMSAALDHQDVTLDQLVAALHLPREAGRNPLFQVLFQCVEEADDPWRFDGLRCEEVDLDAEQAKVDLQLVAFNKPDSVRLELTYATDLYDAQTARRLLVHIANLVAHAVATPDALIDDADMLTGAERTQAIASWNATTFAFPDDATVHELFERQAARIPDLPAVRRADGAVVTYRELNERANRLAHYLRAHDIGTESLVGVCIEHSVEMFVALLGVLKAGAAYVPLDPGLPAERMRLVLDDTSAPIVLSTQNLSALLHGAFDGAVLRLDADWPTLAGLPAGNPQPCSDADNLLYVIYTSGSTGRPKGVLVPHRGVVNYLWWAVGEYGLGGERGAPMLGSIAFDLSVPNFWLPFVGGKCVTLLPPDDGVESLSQLLSAPEDYSLLKITPGHLDVLRSVMAPGSVRSVRTFVVGADELRPETVVGWRRVAPGARIINEYGPTETVVGCSVFEIPQDFDPSRALPIGRPIGNLTMYVLDAGLNPVPIGTVGELYIGGAGVARGYHLQPALTAGKFIPDPFGAVGQRLYRTGDLARYRPDGQIDFLGRTDFQVKVRGYRIELGEVEARLGLHPAVREAVAAAISDATGHKRLFGYVVPVDPASPPSSAELRAFMAAALPSHLIPTVFLVIDEVPLTSAGKVDRGRLPSLHAAAAPNTTPATSTEQVLAAIWREVLGRAELGVHENFFDLGGDSMLAVRVATRARRAGLQLVPTALFRHQTVADLAQAAVATGSPAARHTARDEAGYPLAGLPPELVAALATDGVEDVCRLTPLQTSMLFQTLAAPTPTAYVDAFVYKLDGELDERALRDAWRHVVDRHDCLRTTFAWRGLPHAVQIIHSHAEIDWRSFDWSDLDLAELDERLAGLRHADLRPDVAPPQRFRLVRTGPSSHRLVWLFHHMMLDGWSMPILLGEVFTCYQALADGRTPPALPEPVSFRQHLGWLAGRDAQASAAFWRTTLHGATPQSSLSIVAPADDETGVRTSETVALVPADVLIRLTNAARRHRISLATLLYAAWGLALALDSGRADVVFGGMSTGRNHGLADADGIVGMLMNTLPVRIRFADVPLGDWLRRVNLSLADLRDHEHSGLAEIKRAADLPAAEQLFDTVLVYNHFSDPDLSALDRLHVDMDKRIVHAGAAVVLGVELHEELELMLTFDPDRVDEKSAREQLAVYRSLLEALADPAAQLVDLVPALRTAKPSAAAVSSSDTDIHASVESDGREAFDTEQIMAALWAEVFDVPSVGTHENFLDLGGDSIMAMRIVARARDEGLVVRPADLYTYPTVDGLVRHGVRRLIEPAAPAMSSPVLPAFGFDRVTCRFPTGAVQAVYPLTSTQQGILFHVLGDKPAGYAQVWAYRITQELDDEALRDSWQAMVDRHETLRTTFLWEDLPEAVQVVHVRSTAELRVLDWTEQSEDERADKWRRLIAYEQGSPIDLTAAPPVRIIAVRHDEGFDLVWHSHHILLDGLSVNAALEELLSNYRTASAGRLLPEREPQGGFGDYVAWTRTRDTAAEQAYWKQALTGVELPTPLPPAAVPAQGTGTGWLRVDVPDELTDALESLSRRHRVNLASLMSAAWASLLGRCAQGDDVVFGVTLSCRTAPVKGVEGLLGMLMNTLPLRVRTDRSMTVGERLRQVHESLAALGEHERGSLTEAAKAAKAMAGRSLFDSILITNNARHGATFDWPELSKIDLPDINDSGYALVLEPTWHDGGLQVLLAYRRDRYSEHDAVDLLAGFQASLRDLLSSAEEAAKPTPVETELAQLWADVLNLPSVGVDDDYFDLGGDSIMAIHIVSRARHAGLELTTTQLMELRTVSALAKALGSKGPRSTARSGAAGPAAATAESVPLTPIVRWFTGLDWPHDHYNQGAVLRIDGTVDPGSLRTWLRTLVERHDALRMRLVHEAGGWRQYVAPPDDTDPLRVIDVPGQPVASLTTLAEEAGSKAHSSLSLSDGPLLRGVLLRGASDGDLLVLAAHHIAVDTVSWGVLVDELNNLHAGRVLPAPTTAFAEWSRRLARYAGSEAFDTERATWAGDERRGAPLPVDHSDGRNAQESVDIVSIELPSDLNAAVLRTAAADHDVRVHELLIAALARTLAEFTRSDRITVDIESHGREDLFEDVDLYRTVGWFTAVHPLHVRLPAVEDTACTVRAVKDRLRAIRHRGIGYGLAHCYPAADSAVPSAVPTSAEVVFNYHGQLGRQRRGMFTPANLSSGTTRAGSGLRPHLLEIDAAMVEGRLVVNWGYSVQVHRRATVEQLSESFEKELRRFTRKRPSSVPKKGEDAALSDELLQLMRDHRVPGLAIARFGADGITACWSSGTRTAGSAEQVELDTVFQAGSMSKTVAALTALSLVADGTLQLDADIREALREWRPRRRVTLRHLLGHTSGFARSSPRWSHPGSTPPPRAELLAELREEAEPGTRFEYANSNYLVLEQLLADTTGEEYPRLARRHVLDPLGMRNSTVDAEPPPGRRLALGHLADGRPLPGGWRVGPEVAAGGLWTTAEDMAKVWTDVLRALSGHDAVVLRRAGARHMTTPFADSGYGLGVFVRRMGNRVVVGHAGDNPGFQCLAVCRTDTTTGSIVLANSDSADCLLSSCWPRLAGGDEEAWHA